MPNHSLERCAAVLIGMFIAFASVSLLRPQSPAMKFEAASIRRCGPNVVAPLREGGGLGHIGPSPNRVSKNCFMVMTLLQDAYVIFADGQNRLLAPVRMPSVEKAPAWMSSDLYMIEAKAEGAPGQPFMLGPMMQSLLADRFHLKLHRETRTGPAYELTVAKGGSKLKLNNGTCTVDVPPAAAPRDPATGRPAPGFASGRVSPPEQPGVPCRLMLNLKNGPNTLFVASAATIDGFSSHLSRITGRTVLDNTGLRDKYDIRLEYLPDDVRARINTDDQSGEMGDVQPGATLLTAIEQQLGLKLTSVKGTREVIVIDHIERPSGN